MSPVFPELQANSLHAEPPGKPYEKQRLEPDMEQQTGSKSGKEYVKAVYCHNIQKKKRKGEKERYKYLNAEFQRIARRDKKAFFSDQCKEIEENNRMGKTRDLFKKSRDTKGTFHAKMGWIKDRNGMDLTEAEDIKKRWQEYTEELCKYSFMTQIIMMV